MAKYEKEIKVIFDRWNFYKGKGKWKSHRELTPEIQFAVREVLRQGYTVEQICDAIDNYALILLGGEYRWSYAWTLSQFLLRSRPDSRQEKQFWRFLGNNFVPEDYLSEEVIKNRIEQKKSMQRQANYQKQIKEYKSIAPITPEQRRKIIEDMPDSAFKKRMLAKRQGKN